MTWTTLVCALCGQRLGRVASLDPWPPPGADRVTCASLGATATGVVGLPPHLRDGATQEEACRARRAAALRVGLFAEGAV